MFLKLKIPNTCYTEALQILKFLSLAFFRIGGTVAELVTRLASEPQVPDWGFEFRHVFGNFEYNQLKWIRDISWGKSQVGLSL